MENAYTSEQLKELQALPLEEKVQLTQTRIMEFYQRYDGNVYLSFSGGKDSTVLLDIARRVYPDITAVFFNTGLEYPEIAEFAKSYTNVVELRPKWGSMGKKYGRDADDLMTFRDTLMYIGYPLISKNVSDAIDTARRVPGGGRWRRMHGLYKLRDGTPGMKSLYDFHKYLPLMDLPVRISDRCCNVNKKRLGKAYVKETGGSPIMGTTAGESLSRRRSWLKYGCNLYSDAPKSRPMSFWTEQDVLAYIQKTGLPICSVYGDVVDCGGKLKCTGCHRTGCVFCAFGFHMEKGETRFQRLKQTHPKLYEYCIGGGEFHSNEDYDPSLPAEYWNPKEIWGPSRTGLGMGKVFDWMNDIYGKDFCRYE